MDTSGYGIFRPILSHLTHEAVIDQITFAIRTGRYQPGDKLPHLEELARQMDVSKPVVINAVRTLATAGVLAAQRGNSGGLRVLTNNIPSSMLALSSDRIPHRIAAILEARRAVETELALLCVDRVTDRELTEMDRAITLFVEHQDSHPTVRRHYDHLFHYCFGRAAGSELLAYYQHQILERLSILLSEYFDKEEEAAMIEKLHRDTLAALRSRDRDQVREAMDRHLSPLEIQFKDPQHLKEAP